MVADAAARQGTGPFAPPGAGSHDARIDLKLLQWRALQAVARSARARERLAPFDRERHPDLWAGTVQDGVARGFAVALEEAIELGGDVPDPLVALPAAEPAGALPLVQEFRGKELRRKKDLLVSSGGARIRFSRKEGILFVDRDAGVNSPNCLRFEARHDRGSLDGFEPDPGERPRLFSAQFLQPVCYRTAPGRTELRLEGRLGRTQRGYGCRIDLIGDDRLTAVCLRIAIDNRQNDERLRARLLGVPRALVRHDCTDVLEQVHNDAGGFLAFTLVRACGRLLVDGVAVATPAAQCQGTVEHTFWLGH